MHVIAILLAAGFAALPPLFARELIDTAIPQRDLALVNVLLAVTIGVALASTALTLVNRWLSATIGEGIIFDLRVQLYQHVQKMPIGFFTRTQTGSLLSRLSNDVVGAQATVTTGTTVLSNVVSLLTTLVAMLVLSWKVTIAALAILPLLVLIDRTLSGRIAALTRRRMDVNAEMTTTMQERFNVSGALLVKLFGRPAEEVAAFAKNAGAVRDSGVKSAMMRVLYFAAMALLGSMGVAIVYWLGARAVIDDALTIGTLTALVAYVTRLYEPMTSLAGARVDLLTALISFERCFEVLDAPVAITEPDNAIVLSNPRGRVELDHVWFRYPAAASLRIGSLEVVSSDPASEKEPSNWILRDVTLTAEPGQTVALVGPSGAGKTTLSSLVPRLHDADEGNVRVDGHDVRELSLQSLHDAIGVVTQDTHLFHDSVAANLRYAKPDATDEELVDACKGARIHDLINSLPLGYDTLVGERGHRLSGGEKQRLAIARVLLKQPSILILDEATAHLDSETEVLVQQALDEALSGRTAFVIAHRLSTIRSADLIVVMDEGRIIEQGSHPELLARGGLYAQLYETQYTFEG